MHALTACLSVNLQLSLNPLKIHQYIPDHKLFPQTEAAEEAAASAGQAAESAEEPQITNISASDEDAQEE